MVNAELGTKRSCPSCAGRFYDLNNDPITCPLCSETFVVEPILPSKADSPAPSAPAPVPEAAKAPVAEPSADPIADDDDVDDEVAAIEDVDLGEDDTDEVASEDDNTFLETDDDDENNVTDIVAPGPKANDDT